ncbi:hypothetical protein DKL61_08340 [Gammaproteobacteria bacterium ESL0073]|nr:hypothetical protein DKL61_08340 [Gammaproteobacteria bacterium ESL0073]
MKYLYSLIIILALTCIGIESYFCITERLLPFHLEGAFSRAVFYFSFFTVLSTLALSLGCLFVIFKPHYQSSALAVLRIDGVVGVIITGIVYNLVLRGMYQPNLLVLRITTEFLHVVIPVLGVIGWVFFDPHPVLTKRSVINSFIPPIIYLIYTFIRGAITGLYPYPILDINLIGYAQVLINVGAITACFIGFAFLLYWLDNCRLIKR